MYLSDFRKPKGWKVSQNEVPKSQYLPFQSKSEVRILT